MTGPVEDNERILADEQAFIAAYERARQEFGRIDGVVDVAYGQKQSDGEYRDDIAIVVFVQEKRPIEDLAPQERIPPTFEGYRTDVRVLRQAAFDACDNTTTYKTIQGGIQISARIDPTTGQFSAGTLGCIVRKRGDSSRDNVYLLSNKHVLFALGAGAGDYIFHPFAPSPDTTKFQSPGDSNALGPTETTAFLGNVAYTAAGQTAATDVFIDCAIARIDIDSKCFGSTCTKDVVKTSPGSVIDLQVGRANTITNVRSIINAPSAIGEQVFKVGRTTGRTAGVIRLINAPVTAPADPTVPGSGPIQGHNTIEIDFDPSAGSAVNCKGNARFAEEGDSGALVVDAQGRAIGLHTLGAPPGSPSTFPNNACHIMPVLDNLGVCIPTSRGTSSGSCAATDGTGIAPAATTGTVGTVGTGVSTGAQSPVPVTDVELTRLHGLRDLFRQTDTGRDLHEVFALVRREIGYLVRNARRVTIVWYRNEGPAFLAHTLDHLRGQADQIPLEINGVTRETLLTRMAEVLATHGSNPLRAALQRYRDDLLPILAYAVTAHDGVAAFRALPRPAAETAS